MKVIFFFDKTIFYLALVLTILVIPLCLGLTALEVYGPVSSGYVPYEYIVMVLCIVPSLIGGALLLYRNVLQKLDGRKLVRRYVILVTLQIISYGLIYHFNPPDNSHHVDYSNPTGKVPPEAMENIQKILEDEK